MLLGGTCELVTQDMLQQNKFVIRAAILLYKLYMSRMELCPGRCLDTRTREDVLRKVGCFDRK